LTGLDRLVNRLSLSIVIAGLAILIAVTAAGSPLQILVVTGFIAVVGLGIWLLISMLKTHDYSTSDSWQPCSDRTGR
jgi:hypothetical protein